MPSGRTPPDRLGHSRRSGRCARGDPVPEHLRGDVPPVQRERGRSRGGGRRNAPVTTAVTAPSAVVAADVRVRPRPAARPTSATTAANSSPARPPARQAWRRGAAPPARRAILRPRMLGRRRAAGGLRRQLAEQDRHAQADDDVGEVGRVGDLQRVRRRQGVPVEREQARHGHRDRVHDAHAPGDGDHRGEQRRDRPTRKGRRSRCSPARRPPRRSSRRLRRTPPGPPRRPGARGHAPPRSRPQGTPDPYREQPLPVR